MIKYIKDHNKIAYILYLLIIIIIGIIFCLTYKKEDFNYSLEFENQSKFVLHFSKSGNVVKAKCLNDYCDQNIEISRFLKTNYSDLERQINFLLFDELNINPELNIKLLKGKKNIDDLIKIYSKKENNNPENEPNIESEKTESATEHNTNTPNYSTDNENNSNKESVENTEINTTKPQNITPLDISIIWIPTSYSYYNVNFNAYSTTPMRYNQKDNGSVPYKNGYDLSGYMQIFDLKSQGITTDDACITFTQDKFYNAEAGATTIVPIYNNGNVSYRKFCLGLDDTPYYHKSYKEVATSVNYSSNVYEWINNRWVYLGVLDDLTFTERNPQGYTETFDLLTYIDLSYERIINDQYPLLIIQQRKELEKLEVEETKFEQQLEEEYQKIASRCGHSSSNNLTYECELEYIELSKKSTYQRGIIEEKRSEILGMDFNYMYDFSILDEK